jgi:hypothetical protein
MPRYRVSGTVIASKYLGEFEADTEEEAIEMALSSENAYVSLCHQCSGECENPEIHDANAEPIDEE